MQDRENTAKEKRKNKGAADSMITEQVWWEREWYKEKDHNRKKTTINVLEMNLIFFLHFAIFPNFMIFLHFYFFHVLECSFLMNDGC